MFSLIGRPAVRSTVPNKVGLKCPSTHADPAYTSRHATSPTGIFIVLHSLGDSSDIMILGF